MVIMVKKLDHAGVTFQVSRNCIDHDHWSDNSACLHLPNLQCYKLTEDKQKWYHLVVHLLHTSVQNGEEFLYYAHVWHILQVWHSKWPHPEMAFWWTLSKLPPCSHILHTCWFKLFHRKKSDSHVIWVIFSWEQPALFKGNHAGICIQHPHKSNRVWLHTFPIGFVKEVPVPFALQCIMVVQVTTFQDGILLKTLQASKQCSRILHTCQPSYPHKDIRLATTLNEMFMNKPGVFKSS